MNFLLLIPLAVRLGVLAVVGAVIGGQLNRGIYRLAWEPRAIGPWSAPPEKAPPRQWFDRLPIFGWFALRRESKLHGRGFWIRPMLVELLTTVGLPALYWWETQQGGGLVPAMFFGALVVPPSAGVLHALFLSHAVLLGLMLVASLIDVDEKTIPDSITVPGALAGFALAALCPSVLLPVPEPVNVGMAPVDFLRFTTPHAWSASLDGIPGLVGGLGLFALWCLAVLPRKILWRWRWLWRRPIHGPRVMLASILRQYVPMRNNHRAEVLCYALKLVLGLAAVAAVWCVGGEHWQALLTALVGAAFGGGLIWGVRQMGSAALGVEAMGYGDVTLMAMIGAFVGWQASLIVFFLAPLAGLVIAVGQWITTGRREIWFGPFLCLGAVVLLWKWSVIWATWGFGIFYLGWLIPIFVVICLLLMGIMLTIWRFIKERLLGIDGYE